MKSIYLSLICLALVTSACGGLRHIPNVASETQWRPLAAISPTKAAAALATVKPPPTEVPFRQIELRGSYVAVFDILDKSKKLSPEEIDGLTDYLASKIAEDGLFHVVPRDEIKKRLRAQKKKSFKECYDQSCQIEIGREIAAQKTLSVTISPIGSSCVVTAALFDLKKAATDATASSRGKCIPDNLVTQIENIVAKFRRMAK
ncbi:MAG: hypothetical protein JRJ87_16040 [Deltaproteobacteria bacterium]|nr:hypothetical protein [Deltaproteobacteria bacterium]